MAVAMADAGVEDGRVTAAAATDAIFRATASSLLHTGEGAVSHLGPETAGANFLSLWFLIWLFFVVFVFHRRSSRLGVASMSNYCIGAREAGFEDAGEEPTANFRFRPLRHEDPGFSSTGKMRPLTEEETRTMFEKIAK